MVAQPYLGEIRMFAGNYAPAGWMFCYGQTLPISENDTLFNLIGTTYGGDGKDTFQLPDLRSRIPIGIGGAGAGADYVLAQTGGAESVTLAGNQLPRHNHTLVASSRATDGNPGGGILSQPFPGWQIYGNQPPFVPLSLSTISPAGGGQPHENRQPFLVISFIISLFGIYPQAQ